MLTIFPIPASSFLITINSFAFSIQCFIYHIDQGLRSGGGIADVLEPASGDPNEFTRLFFDITFFFVVIVILLAIIQGELLLSCDGHVMITCYTQV